MKAPNKITIESAHETRALAEKGGDPALYTIAASAFRALNMPNAERAMLKRAEHYQSLIEREPWTNNNYSSS